MRRSLLFAAGLACFVLSMNAATGLGQDAAKPATHKVRYEKVPLNIVERGALEAALRTHVYCRLPARGSGSNVAGTIRWIVEDGSQVKAGQRLMEIDDLELQEKLRGQKAATGHARAGLLVAETQLAIGRAQADADLKSATAALQLARLDQAAFEAGEARTTPLALKSRLHQAEADLLISKEQTAQIEQQRKDGKATAVQVEASQLRTKSVELALEKVQKELEIWQKYTLPRSQLVLKNRLAEAEHLLEQVKRHAEARSVQADLERAMKKAAFEVEQTKQQEIEGQLKNCHITAPHDGMVVYYVPEASRPYSAQLRAMLVPHENVLEGQRLMTICDLRSMHALVSVPEAHVSKLRPGQEAQVLLDAFPDRRARGKVKSVATVASQRPFLERDVKVYEVVVSLGENDGAQRPGMTATVMIATGKTLDKVLTVPVKALVQLREKKTVVCYVQTPEGVVARAVTVGLNTGEVAVIESGLKEGDEVILDPKPLPKSAKP